MIWHPWHLTTLPLLVLCLLGQASSQPETSTGSAVGQATPSGAKVAVVPIRGTIYRFTLDSLERRVDRAIAAGASVIVIELDTYGGTVHAAMEIAKYIKQIPAPTVAWINNNAYSAGIMIASACDQIVMSPSSATGDCAPIIPTMEMAPAERAKVLSPILEEFRDNARNNGYDYAPFHAMCVLGVEVYYVEHATSGVRRLVNQIDFALMVHGIHNGDHQQRNYTSPNPDEPVQVAQPAREVATDADISAWKPIETLPSGATAPKGRVHDGKTFLTVNQTRAADIGLSLATIKNQAELGQHLRAASVSAVHQTWSEDLAGFLTWNPIRLVLILALLLGVYIEFQAPGIGVGGLVALISLLILLGAPLLIGLAEIWHILMFFIGFVLLVIELLFLSSFGILGVLGLVMMFAGIVLSVVPTGGGAGVPGFRLPPPEMWRRVMETLTYSTTALIAGIVAFVFLNRYFGQIPGLNHLVLGGDHPRTDGTTRHKSLPPVAGDEVIGQGQLTVGATGRATTDLRPTGQATLDGQVIDVISHGNWIDRGQAVTVVKIHGNRIIVDHNRP